MKRISILLAVILLVAVLVPTAFAAQEQLAIDNDNIYNGMGRSYSAGYIPTVSGGKATIVLPLVYEGSEGIVGDKITVTPDLGATSNSPFVFSNYEMDIILANNSVNNGAATVPSYLISLTIPLASDRINGVYPLHSIRALMPLLQVRCSSRSLCT